MPERPLKSELSAPFTFSQSSLQDYTGCNRRFQLRYIEQLQWPAIENAPVLENERHQIEGQQFHRMLQQHFLGVPDEKISFIANNSGSENLARWWNNFSSVQSAGLTILPGQTAFPELILSAPIGGHRLMAKYDLVALKDDRVLIYDWKTYHKRPKDEWVASRLQTRVYPALIIVAGAYLNGNKPISPEQVEMTYWYADFPSEPARFAYNETLFKRDWDFLNRLVSEITSKQSFPLTEDEKQCGFCAYRSYCERGIEAAEGEDLEPAAGSEWNIDLEQIQEIEF